MHTPGEWKIRTGNDNELYIERDGQPIAKVLDRKCAPLLAVAPELYDYVVEQAARNPVADRLIKRADGVAAFHGIH